MPAVVSSTELTAAIAAADAASNGAKDAAYIDSLISAIGSGYRRVLRRNGTTVWSGTASGSLSRTGTTMNVAAVTANASADADINSGSWTHRIEKASDATVYIESPVGAPGSGLPGILSTSLVNGESATAAAGVLNGPAIDVAPSDNYSIMFIGDSLFTGSTDSTFVSPRAAFQAILAANSVQHTMVGPYTVGFGGGPQPNHGAAGGRSIDSAASANNIRDNLTTILGSSYQPEIIVLLAGWNDLFIGGSAATTAPDRYEDLYDDIRSRRPLAKIVLCTLTLPDDVRPYTDANWLALNSRIRTIAAANASSTTLCDLAIVNLTGADLYDYVHFDTGGAQKVADAIYAAMVAASFVVVGAPVAAVANQVIDDMKANTIILNNPPDQPWMRGGAVQQGADLRSVAVPSWWGGNNFAGSQTYWTHLLPWYVVHDRVGHQSGKNVRAKFWDLELWVLEDATPTTWRLIDSSAGPPGNSYSRGVAQTGGDASGRYESDGSFSAKLDFNGSIYHGYGNGTTDFDPSTVIALHVRMWSQLILEDPLGPDERSQVAYAINVGLDPRPFPGVTWAQLGQGYLPGCGSSRWKSVTNDVTVHTFTTLASAFTVDASVPRNSRHTITDAALRAAPPPAF